MFIINVNVPRKHQDFESTQAVHPMGTSLHHNCIKHAVQYNTKVCWLIAWHHVCHGPPNLLIVQQQWLGSSLAAFE